MAATLAGAGVLIFSAPAQAIEATTLSITCGSGVAVSQPATCTATVADELAGTPPTGTVEFSSTSPGKLSEPTCELAGAEPTRSCSVQYTPDAVGTGTHEIAAKYEGDSSHAGSSNTTKLSVLRTTGVTVSCGPGVLVSQSATCTAMVTDTTAEGTPSPPTGTVTFTSDTPGARFGLEGACTLTPLASATRSGCSLEYVPGQVGSGLHTITATYGGDTAHAHGSALGTLAVAAPAPPSPSPAPVAVVAPAATGATQPAAPTRPTCRVRATQRWRKVAATKRRSAKVEVPELAVAYTCDQDAAVGIGGSVTIPATKRAGKVIRSRTINLTAVSSSAVLGKPRSAVVALPSSAAKALRSGGRASVVVSFKVANANGTGVATLKFSLTPPLRHGGSG